MQNYAILVDAGFAKRKLGNAKSPADIQKFSLLFEQIKSSPHLENQRLHRIYYYDSTPLEETYDKPLSTDKIDFAKSHIVGQSRALFEQLAKYPHVALRLGELSFNGWQIRTKVLNKSQGKTELNITEADLNPNITQKGVDMRIGMDIAALTLKKQVQTIVLVTGDSDFVPAMKFARREGSNLFLVTLGHSVKPTMLEHSDLVLEVNVQEILNNK